MADPTAGALLDTHALIWMIGGEALDTDATSAIKAVAKVGSLLVSAVSAWEIGLLASPKRAHPLLFSPDPAIWFARATARTGVRVIPLTATVAIASTTLPEPLHDDPADRFLIATARDLRVPLVTRDRRILTYAAAGHLEAITC